MLNVQKYESLANQYQFFARGDLMYAECSRETRDAFTKHVKAEHAYAQANGGRFRDGSKITP